MSVVDTAALRATAEAATPGGRWAKFDGDSFIWAADDDIVADAEDGTAAHIAAFDPPTVLALLAELDTLRATVAHVEAALEVEGLLTCGRLGLACMDVLTRDRWCRACCLRAALVSPTPDPTTP